MTGTQASTAPLTYSGPKEVLVQTPVVLEGTFDPNKVVKVSLVAEDKFPFKVEVDRSTGTWQVKLGEGFYNVGARWLRLKGTDTAGNSVSDQVINITVSNQASTVGQPLVLKILTDTLFKIKTADSASLRADQKVAVKAGQTFQVSRYEYIDNHLKVALDKSIAPFGSSGYFFEQHAELKKGDQVFRFDIDDVPVTIPGAAQLLVTQNTVLKANPSDSTKLAANQKVDLALGQSFQITGYASIKGHFKVTFAKAIAGFGIEGYVYWQHVKIQKNGKEIQFDPEALTVTVLENTVFKKRPVDSNNLKPEEKLTLAKGSAYGVLGYTAADGHFRVALTENLPKFGNTGYLFAKHVQLKQGTKPLQLTPAKVELNVPYFSQLDNNFRPYATCNVTSIAMVLRFYGLRSSSGGQLEDEFYQWCVNHYGPGSQTDNTVLVQLVKAYGFKGEFNTNRTWDQIRSEIASGRPVVVGGFFTHSGHIVCVIGYTPTGFIVNDPYGDALSGYQNSNGTKVFYPLDYMEKMCDPEPGSGHIYAHFISR